MYSKGHIANANPFLDIVESIEKFGSLLLYNDKFKYISINVFLKEVKVKPRTSRRSGATGNVPLR